MRNIHNDCLYNYCGNVVEWADFRYGTHGSLLLKWPSGLKVQPCLNTRTLVRSCDSACSLMIGAQCKMNITYNLEWHRTMANNTVSPKCPMPRDLYLFSVNSTTVIDRRLDNKRASNPKARGKANKSLGIGRNQSQAGQLNRP